MNAATRPLRATGAVPPAEALAVRPPRAMEGAGLVRLWHRMCRAQKAGRLGRARAQLIRRVIHIRYGCHISPESRPSGWINLPHPVAIVVGHGVDQEAGRDGEHRRQHGPQREGAPPDQRQPPVGSRQDGEEPYGSALPEPLHGSVPARERSAVPVGEQRGRDRHPARDLHLPRSHRVAELLAGEPPGRLDLGPVDVDLPRLRVGDEPQHQAGRQRPRLVAEVGHLPHRDADLLQHLAPYGVLERLAGLAEAIDAICLNQLDNEEREHQVKLISESQSPC